MKFNPFFKPMCMRFEGEGDLDGGGGGNGDPVSVINADGTFIEGWYKSYPEEYHETLSRFKKFEDMPNSYMNLRSKFNKPADRVLVLPDDNSSDAERAEFHQRLGVPEEADQYEFELNPDIKNIDVDDARLKAFREIAKKHNIPKSKFQGIVNDYLALIDKDAGDFELIQANNEAKELEEDNKIADGYFGKSKDERIARADLLLRKYGNIEIKNDKGEVVANAVDKLIEKYPSMKHSPWLTMILDKIADDMSPQRLQGLTGVSAPTNDAIKNKIKDLRNKPEYSDISHPDHKKIQEEVMNLYKQLS
jgi:hypothetical protein